MLEKILEVAVRGRWAVVLIAVAVGAVGARSLLELPIDAVPDITNNQVQINTLMPALSPAEIEKQVTFVIESSLGGVPGLQSTRSLSRNGFSQVTAVFDDSVDIYFARAQVTERLSGAREALPTGAEPTMGPISTGLGEVYMYTVEYEHLKGQGAPAAVGVPGWQPDGGFLTPEGETLRSDLELAAHLRTVQDWIIRPQLRTVPGVAGVDTIGGYVKQYHVQPDPMKLVSYGLTFADVITALNENNVSAGAGYIEHRGESYVVRVAGRIERADEIAALTVATRNGVPIRMRDVAAVAVGPELRTGSASENGAEVVVGTALMLIGANSRTVAAAVDARLTTIARSLPPGIRTKTVLNRTGLVNSTIETVKRNLAEGAILVVVVLLLLLGHVRGALICAVAIPMAMLMTATGMVQGHISGNLMSLGAVDFGLIVDGAVIIVENCLRTFAERQHALGRVLTLEERLAATFAAAKEVLGVSAFGQAIIVTVYLPILALSGIEGKMFRPMALTVVIAIVCAFVLSMTLIPALTALLVRGKVKEKEVLAIRMAKFVYAPVVRLAVKLRWLVIPLALAAFGGACWLFTTLGQEFVPTLDEKDIAIQATRIPSTSLTQSQAMQFDVERALSALPEVAFVFSKAGTAEVASDPMPPCATDTFVILKPRDQWPDPHATKAALIERMSDLVNKLPGNNYEFTQPIQMRFNELIAGVRGDVAVKVYGDDFDKMQETAQQIGRELSAIEGAVDVKVEQTEGLPVMVIDIDRPAIARHGLTAADVQNVVAVAVGGRQAGVVFEGDRRFDIVVRLPGALRDDHAALGALPVPLHAIVPGKSGRHDTMARPTSLVERVKVEERGGFVPLSALTHINVSEGPNQISREDGKRRVVVQCNIRGRDVGSFVAEAQRRVAGVALPPGGWLAWGGQFENLAAAKERLVVVVPACFALVFLLLMATFRSFRHALVVFTGVPLGLTGGVVALWLRSMPFSISAAVGFIALSGVAVLNGLVLVAFINGLKARGLSTDDAIRQGALTRLRPVLMTALVASLGFVPMALATGAGAEVQKPLATVVIGGLVSSTVLTLVVLPGLYRVFSRRDRAGVM